MRRSSHDYEEFDGDEAEQILSCVAAVDVAKASGMVCVRRPHPSIEGRRTSRVWEVDSTTNAILALGADLVALGVQRVVLESTSDYRRPFFYLLEGCGVDGVARQRPRCQAGHWTAQDGQARRGVAREAERAGDAAAEFRATTGDPRVAGLHAATTELVEERSRNKQRLEKLLEDALIKLSSVATDLLGVSSRAMIEALIAGERDPRLLADQARGTLNAKRSALIEALNGRFDDHHADLARVLLDQIDA